MAAERDQAGAPGPGLSGGGFGGNRDVAGMNAGTTGSKAMGDRPGTGEVHTGLHGGSTAGEYGGIAFAGQEQKEGLKGRASNAADSVRGAAEETADRVGSAASGAANRVSRVAGKAQNLMEERGLLDNPVPVLAGAFAVGFILASLGESRQTKATRARSELRTALMAGVSAGVAQGARGFLGQAGRSDGFLNSILRNLLGQMGQEQGGGGGGSSQGRSQQGRGSTAGGTTAGMGGTRAGMSGAGTAGQHRPPSHRENF